MRGDAPEPELLLDIVIDDNMYVDVKDVIDNMLLAEAEGLAIISFIFADCCYIGVVAAVWD